MNELGPDARAILDRGRHGDDPTAADRARIRASVARAIAGGGALLPGEAALPAKASGMLAGGWKVFLAVVAIGAASAVATVHLLDPREDPATIRLPAAPGSSGAPAVATPAELQAPSAEPPTAQRAAATSPALELPVPAPTAEPIAATPALRAPVVARRPPQAAVALPDPAPTAEAPLPAPQPPPPSAPAVAAGPSLPAAPSTAPETLAEEARRLREAHAALKGGDASKALALLDERGAAGAQLREERTATRILALCDLGRVADARALAARFLSESPRSPLADRVRASCAGH